MKQARIIVRPNIIGVTTIKVNPANTPLPAHTPYQSFRPRPNKLPLTAAPQPKSAEASATIRLQKAFRWNPNLIAKIIPAARQAPTPATWEDIINLSWQEFEDWVPLQLSHLGFDCAITKKSGDGGGDTIASWPTRPQTHLVVSAKHYPRKNSVGARDIQVLIGACTIWGATSAAIVSTGYLSKAAQAQVAMSSHGYRIFTINRETILTPKAWFKPNQKVNEPST